MFEVIGFRENHDQNNMKVGEQFKKDR